MRCPCGRVATVELLNSYNTSCGQFCKRCGSTRLKELQRSELRIPGISVADAAEIRAGKRMMGI